MSVPIGAVSRIVTCTLPVWLYTGENKFLRTLILTVAVADLLGMPPSRARIRAYNYIDKMVFT